MDAIPHVTSEHLARCLDVLKRAEGLATAAEIGGKLNLGGHRESQRRHVRAIIKILRERGHWIVATGAGCWLTADPSIWQDYLNHRAIDARRIIGEAAARKRSALAGTSGQGYLFNPPFKGL